MVYFPVGLAPRIQSWPIISWMIAAAFLCISIFLGPETLKYQDRIRQAHEAKSAPVDTKWAVPSDLIHKKEARWNRLVEHDAKLSPWVHQNQGNNQQALWITPWIIPQFSVLVMVVGGLLLFGGFIERRVGPFAFAFIFVSLYYLGYFVEAFEFSSQTGLTLGGASGLFILGGAYLALFPLREMCLWMGDDLRPMASLPVWTAVCLTIILLESFLGGGYTHLFLEASQGYFHFALLVVSYFSFSLVGKVRPLGANYLSHSEVRLEKKLIAAQGPQALVHIKSLLRLNPSHLGPLDIYYKRVIESLGDQPLSPENLRFLNQYLGILVAHHYDHQGFQRIGEMLKRRPKEVLLPSYFKLLTPKEWLTTAGRLEKLGAWPQALSIYAACTEHFYNESLRSEALKRAEFIIHKMLSECVENSSAREPVLASAREFLLEQPHSSVSKILSDHLKHFKKVLQDQEASAKEVA